MKVKLIIVIIVLLPLFGCFLFPEEEVTYSSVTATLEVKTLGD